MMGIRVSLTLIASLGALILTGSGTIRANELDLSRSSISGGGVMQSTAGGLELSGAIGQPGVGTMIGRNLVLNAGFWFPLDPGDCNTDGGVSLLDYAGLIQCLSGPATRLPFECVCFDLDRDNDVDLLDVAEFQESFTGG